MIKHHIGLIFYSSFTQVSVSLLDLVLREHNNEKRILWDNNDLLLITLNLTECEFVRWVNISDTLRGQTSKWH